MRWVKRVGLGLVGLGLAAGLAYAWMPKPVAVDLAVARRASLDVEISEDGQTRVRDRFVVSVSTSGELQRIELEPGAIVAAGDVLARVSPPHAALLDPRSRKEAVARVAVAVTRQRAAQTAIERATMGRDAAVRDAERARRLVASGAITVSERERAELAEQLAIRDLSTAELERAAASAEIQAARAMLEAPGPDRAAREVEIAAPVGGKILRVLRDSAGPIAAGTPLFELGDPRAIEVVVDVMSSDAAQVTAGMPVTIERWGGANLKGTVRRVEPSAFTRISALGVEEQRVHVVANLDAAPPSLGDGFRVAATIVTWHGDDILTVPASAVFRDHGSWAVWVIREHRVHLQRLTLGHQGRLDVEVASGLSPGDQVVLHPGDNLAEDRKIEAR
ncbi:MAG: efflux RND transporter periplasmic adaptor subunit [Myxococcales bacterium]|nr:efflux RND transporter periplasmic adaptor subunit [Myxococcales bacterium]